MKSSEENSGTQKTSRAFPSLTWLDLESWVGAKTVSRGKSYQRRCLVRDLAITGSGELVAWVQVSSRYATKAEAWNRYLGELRAAHARKPRLLQVLDSLTGKAIVDG